MLKLKLTNYTRAKGEGDAVFEVKFCIRISGNSANAWSASCSFVVPQDYRSWQGWKEINRSTKAR